MLAKRQHHKVMLDTWQGDITRFAVDVMVTAANAELVGGGGVDGAIHKAAGPELLAACQQIGTCPTGSAVITDAFDLMCKKVIHAVGPIYQDGGLQEAEQLSSAYRSALDLFHTTKLRHISFPAISAGVYGYPKEEAAQVTWLAIKNWLKQKNADELGHKRITLVLYDSATYRIYTDTLLSTFKS